MAQRTRAQRLNGLFPLSYMGVVPVSPTNFIIDDRPPNSNDSKNFYLGDVWLDDSGSPTPPINENIWMLVSLENGQATWVNFGGGDLETLTGDTGGPVSPDGADNINTLGTAGKITVTGNPGTNTLTWDLDGSVAQSFPTDSGTATPAAGVLNIITSNATNNAGASVLFSAPGPANTVQLNVTDATSNTFIGNLSGNLALTTATHSTAVGNLSLSNITSGTLNCAFGSNALIFTTTSSSNVAIGSTCLASLVGGNGGNTCVGTLSGEVLVSGERNTLIGYLSGFSYAGAESDNIILGRNIGVLGESATTRIGVTGTQTSAYFAGINGNTVGNPVFVTIDTVTDQLGVSAGTPALVTSGHFNPTLSFGGGSTGITYTNQKGYWQRVGDLVMVFATITTSSKGASTGTARIDSLPFSIPGTFNVDIMDGGLATGIGITWDVGNTMTHCNFENGTSSAILMQDASGGGGPYVLTDTNFANVSQFTIYGSYFTSALP